jgi:hypothetical protein
MELARVTGVESLKFIKGKPIDCCECPVIGRPNFCHVLSDMIEVFDSDAAELACYGAFMRFLFSED